MLVIVGYIIIIICVYLLSYNMLRYVSPFNIQQQQQYPGNALQNTSENATYYQLKQLIHPNIQLLILLDDHDLLFAAQR